MDFTFTFPLFLILSIILYSVILQPWLRKRGLSPAQLQLLDFAAQKGVLLAEQLFLTGKLPKEERKKTALKMAGEMLRMTGIVPEQYMEMIDGLIEAAVRVLPKTNSG